MKTGALRLNHQRPLLASSTNPKSGNSGKQEPASTPGYMTDFRQLQGAPRVPSVPLASVMSGPGLQGQTAGTQSPDQPPPGCVTLNRILDALRLRLQGGHNHRDRLVWLLQGLKKSVPGKHSTKLRA